MLQIVVFDKELGFFISPNALFAVLFFFAGMFFTSKAYSIYEGLDRMDKGVSSDGKSNDRT